jgi:GT2 family glycosyltransferase
MKNFAIVILNYNTYDDTLACVDSIKKYTENSSYQIYVVDNASPDKSGSMLKMKYAGDDKVSVIVSESNLGFSGGNNIGIRKALEDGFEYIYLLNSDIVLQNDAFAFMQAAFESNDNVAVVGPSILDREKRYAQFARRGISLASYLASRRGFVKFFPQVKNKLRFYKYSIDEDFVFDGMVYGCCFGMTADFIRQSKCLDENLFMFYEEDILAYVLQRLGKKAMIASKAKIIHNEGVSTEKSSGDRLFFMRFYRWTSVLYVLRNYAKVNILICGLLSLQNIAEWVLLSLLDKKYRGKLSAFIAENRRVLTVKP